MRGRPCRTRGTSTAGTAGSAPARASPPSRPCSTGVPALPTTPSCSCTPSRMRPASCPCTRRRACLAVDGRGAEAMPPGVVSAYRRCMAVPAWGFLSLRGGWCGAPAGACAGPGLACVSEQGLRQLHRHLRGWPCCSLPAAGMRVMSWGLVNCLSAEKGRLCQQTCCNICERRLEG